MAAWSLDEASLYRFSKTLSPRLGDELLAIRRELLVIVDVGNVEDHCEAPCWRREGSRPCVGPFDPVASG